MLVRKSPPKGGKVVRNDSCAHLFAQVVAFELDPLAQSRELPEGARARD